MVDDKDKDNEVVGLEEPEESLPPKSIGRLRKYIIPFAIGGGLFLSAMIIPNLFVKKSSQINISQAAEKNDSATAMASLPIKNDSLVEKMSEDSLMADLSFLDIDTAALMRELGFLGFDSSAYAESTSSAARDSADTLNWIEREKAKLALEKATIDSQKLALDSLNVTVTRGLNQIGQAEAARLANLARLYDGMKPDEVSKLFENLDDSIIIKILPRMKPVNAAKILALMPPKRAALISTQFISIAKD